MYCSVSTHFHLPGNTISAHAHSWWPAYLAIWCPCTNLERSVESKPISKRRCGSCELFFRCRSASENSLCEGFYNDCWVLSCQHTAVSVYKIMCEHMRVHAYLRVWDIHKVKITTCMDACVCLPLRLQTIAYFKWFKLGGGKVCCCFAVMYWHMSLSW